jgi:hypothetical protein
MNYLFDALADHGAPSVDGDNQLVARNGKLEEQHEHPTWQT